MIKQNKAYKFRIYPTEKQCLLIRKTFGCVRFVYNKMLAERKETYETFKHDKDALKKVKYPTPAKYKKEFAWLKEVDSLALANAQINLDKAYKAFFKGNAKFQKFKSKRHKQSYTTNVVNGKDCIQNVVGLDFAMDGLFVDSETGKKANYLRFYRQMLNKLVTEQRKLSRKKKGSSKWNKQRIRVAKIQEKVANQRKNFLQPVRVISGG